MSEKEKKIMKKALRLAKKGLGRTSPNPAVGAVIVRNGNVIASGYHKKAGHNHAEVEALSTLGGGIRAGDTLYVTMEPCNHHGKTPPCTEAIIKSGLKRVVIGMSDPNPAVSGGGAEFLRKRGIEVKPGVLESECRRLNEAYIKFVTTGLPFVIAKSALTMDGWSATSTGHSKWISNDKSR
ncbi:bifunctional diaminohydroxyphosphoribosylaminopyrimidine deaminase/5-amino-6-(5-phosphoribosylamino)uracil reductase RibD, partial [Thermodesulfobacteriota bacterium]